MIGVINANALNFMDIEIARSSLIVLGGRAIQCCMTMRKSGSDFKPPSIYLMVGYYILLIGYCELIIWARILSCSEKYVSRSLNGVAEVF